MEYYRITEQHAKDFERDGYLLVEDLFAAEETDMLLRAARGGSVMLDASQDIVDAQGMKTKLTLWNHPGDDIFGMVARCPRVVDTMEVLLGGEVYHYHSKITMKQPREGGAWEWHQDYGYWYKNGCLFPYMASCYIALDPATKENGCLQVLRGSHHMGRIEHGFAGQQTGADPERVTHAMERLELVYCEMKAGAGLFFHGNLLHRSDANHSEEPRWGLICCYNAARNDPYCESHHPRYTPLAKVSDGAVRQAGQAAIDRNRDFYKAERDKTTLAGKA